MKWSFLCNWTVLQLLCGGLVDIARAVSVYTEYKNIDVSNFDNCCGHTSGCQPQGAANYYRYIEPSIRDPNIIYIGAMNYLFSLNTSTPQLECTKFQYLPQSDATKDRCTRQGKSDIPDCQNHIREIFEIGNLLEVCGTGAYSPMMYYLNTHNMTVNSTGDNTKLVTCPYDPLDNYTLLYSEYNNPGNSSAMYFGFYMDFIKNFPVFLRPRYTHKGVQYIEKNTDTEDASWLDSPQFVGSFDMNNSVMMFFRERAVEFQESARKIYSRVGKVCKNDLGGGTVETTTKKWLSFQKARLICSLPGSQPYYFDDIYDVAYDGSQYFYALFYKPGADLNASAICVYDIADITAAFDGHFMYKNGSMVTPDPSPRLDNCNLHDNNPSIFQGLSSHHQLMSTRVQPVSSEPIFYKHGHQLLRLALGPLQHRRFRNIYVGTSEGEIYDIFVNQNSWKTYHNAKLLPFFNGSQPNRPIWKIMLKDNNLILGTDYSVTKVPLDTCQDIGHKVNKTKPYNLDECLHNTRCKIAQCSSKNWICTTLDDNSCQNSITVDDVPDGMSVRQYLMSDKGYNQKVVPMNVTAFEKLYFSLSVEYPIRVKDVHWKKNNKYLDDQDRYVVSGNELIVKNVQSDDGGQYSAEDHDGMEVAKYIIKVETGDRDSTIDAWKQAFIEWSEAFSKWQNCAGNYLDSCQAVPGKRKGPFN